MAQLIDDVLTMSRKERAVERQIAEETKLLVLDDLGAESTQDWVLNKIDSIITNRYNNKLPILVTTNIDIRTKAVVQLARAGSISRYHHGCAFHRRSSMR